MKDNLFDSQNYQRNIERANYVISHKFKNVLDESEKLFWNERNNNNEKNNVFFSENRQLLVSTPSESSTSISSFSSEEEVTDTLK